LIEGCFGDLDRLAATAGFALADGVVLDIGVSSMQLDDPARGFSFQGDGPLDMRMAASGPTAADVINTAEEAHLADILFHLGEERSARGIARAIVARRQQQPFTRTSELAQLAARVLGREKIAGRHAATRTFQALRIYVNDELGELAGALSAAERVLAPGGRLLVVTFHSLEDRLVKNRFRDLAWTTSLPPYLAERAGERAWPVCTLVTRKAVVAGDAEIARNPRARSARLRVCERTAEPNAPSGNPGADRPRSR
jgi:16S rRNA (cytosine1402-N4)-methyltransferase